MQEKRHSLLGLPRCAPWLLSGVLACLVVLPTPLSWGQAVSATLLGNVTDDTGAAVANADSPDLGKRYGHPTRRGHE